MVDSFRNRRRVLWGAAFLLVGAAAACNPPIDYTQKRCDADHACPGGWRCESNGYCAEVGSANAVTNPGFESGLSGWAVSHGTIELTDGGRDSPTAALWKPDGISESVLTTLSPSVANPESGGWYCARAWVLGTTDSFVELRIYAGGSVDVTESVSPNGGTWKQIQTSTLSGAQPLSIGLTSGSAAGARTLLVDDLALWASPDTACNKPP